MSFEDASFAASPEVGVQNPSQNCENRCADDSYGQSDQRQHPVAEPRPQQDAAKCEEGGVAQKNKMGRTELVLAACRGGFPLALTSPPRNALAAIQMPTAAVTKPTTGRDCIP